MALYLVIQISAFLSRIVPRSWRYLIGTAVGDAVFLAWPAKRRVLVDNMATVLGLSPRDPQVRRLALKSMRNYCKYLVEFLELPSISPTDEIVAGMKVQGIEHLELALARGKGVILATGHFGTIETASMRLSGMTEFHAIYDTFRPAYLDRLIQRKRMEKGIKLIPVQAVRKMLHVLHDGGTLIMLFDRPVQRSKGVPVRLFGRDTALPGGPALLTMKTGADLIPVYAIRQPDKTFESIVFPPIRWTPTGNRDRDAQLIMQKLADTLQTMARSRPDQWYMFRSMWPESKPASAPASAETAPDRPRAS